MAKDETKTCHACRETLKWDWEVCPFCGAFQENFDVSGRPSAAVERPPPPGDVIEYEPAENEKITRPPPGPLPVIPLKRDSLPTDDILYAVMRLTADRMNIPLAGRRLCAILGRPLADITCRIRATKGFLARDVPLNKLLQVAGLMEELRIDAVAVSEQLILSLPWVYRTAELTESGRGLTCAATSPADRTWKLTFAPEQVRLIAGGRVMYSAKLTIEQPIYDPYKNISLLKKRFLGHEGSRRTFQKEIHGHDYLIYVFLRRPERLLVIKDSDIDYEKMERRRSAPERMRQQAQLLAETIDSTLNDDGLRLLARVPDEDDPAWVPFTFATQRGLDGYAEWRYNLSLIEK